MPELPEVETMRRGVLGVVGATIANVKRPPCTKKPISITPAMGTFRRKLLGKQIIDIARVGKRVVLVLDDDSRVIMEPRMTGLVLITDPPTLDHLRLEIQLENCEVDTLLFWDRRGLGTIRWMSASEFDEAFSRKHIGPDALDIDWKILRDCFATSRRAIKVALLDQKRLAGIGNLYAAEILHLAKVHPEKECDELTAHQWKKMATAMQQVLTQAIRYEGSTLGDGTYRNALNQDGGYQSKHLVYAKAGEVCGTCQKEEVLRIVQAQRSTFYCPRCQKL
ncbi:MAG: formamidopyrimidine-DNA glycosylase [Blastopirellula sp.]|nr:MAG: formamidopyrimidine-DNA glycosylase [Blastopirellula sp.]